MRVSISITDYTWPEGPVVIPQRLREVATAADAVGVDTVWVADHLVQADPTVPDDTEMLEAFTTLGHLAGATDRVRLGTLVAAATFRPPALLVKAVTTLDVLSEGRAWLGVGAGYQEDEATAMGLPMPPVAERFEHLEDLLRLARQMWSGDPAPFHGARHQLAAPSCDPAPVTKPHPPILVGGTGEKRTLRLVAEHADACNLFDLPDDGATVRHKLDVLARHCESVGRPRDEIQTTLSTRLAPAETTADLVARCERVAGWGVEHLIFVSSTPWAPADLDVLVSAAADVTGLRTERRTP